MKSNILALSTHIGKNSLLVQGAGGNISWKENNILWIKASGTWLKDAEINPIFLPLDLQKTRQLIHTEESDLSSAYLTDTTLRPSIETSLHALLPQSIVVHIHAVDVIALAVQKRAQSLFAEKLKDVNWAWIDYAKPGLPLTKKIMTSIDLSNPPDILVLGNHGLVIASNSIEQLEARLEFVLLRCKMQTRKMENTINSVVLEKIQQEWKETEYQLPHDPRFHTLALDPLNLEFARHRWVMYPDHAVFLGEKALIIDKQLNPENSPPCIIIENKAILTHQHFNSGQQAMLHCYLDVISRLLNIKEAVPLNEEQIVELIHWNAEKYRQTLNERILSQ